MTRRRKHFYAIARGKDNCPPMISQSWYAKLAMSILKVPTY